MEATQALGIVENELKNQDKRISSLHGRIGEIQVQQSNQQTNIKVLSNEVNEARKDIEESKQELGGAIRDAQTSFDERLEKMQKAFNETIEKTQLGFDKKFAALTGAVRWGTGTMIALIGILLTILVGGH